MGAVVLLSVHLLFVLLFFVLSYKDIVVNSRLMLALVIFIPVVGAITFIAIDYLLVQVHLKGNIKFSLSGKNIKENEAMSKDNSVSEYSSLRNAGLSNDDAVPLEDALIMEDRKLRRSVMLDVLMDDSKNHSHSAIINKARLNDDVEVVHYATAATIEITTDYENKLAELDKKYKEATDDKRKIVLDEYINVIETYINTGILQGRMLRIHQATYFQLLAERINYLNDIDDYEKLANNYIKMKQYDLAEGVISDMAELWPNSEHTWLTQIRLFSTLKRGKDLHELITRIKKGSFYKSRKLQEVIDFWDY
ncbi:hypothetical protein [Lachnobacterium bovis]|uniref:Uncharacterized protein n=1 Tax=Lachnobacterium bovis DSM 14045 TaxID=1122142 RepID=A0A1H3F7P6_9FIRM|nr:hypothetical protein [Lachnobacterium bovis]SDX86214.1 hypothetical protein SAMN02910414_00153 [Lachnobacterium bovis DSM 14045]